MKTLVLCHLLFSLIFQPLQVFALIKQSKTTSEFKEIVTDIYKIVSENNLQQTLIVFDIDNTILKTITDFGSEHWFLWQKKLIEEKNYTLPAVTQSIDDLLKIQGWIYQIGSMSPVDPLIPPFTDKLKNNHHVHLIALTSRMLGVRDATQKELILNKINLSSTDDFYLKRSMHLIFPYDLKNLNLSGLTSEDVQKYNLKKPLKISFENGVLFTQGQHKGIMLKIFLFLQMNKYKNIIFIDDRLHHIEGVKEVFNDKSESLYTFHYTQSKEWIDPFNEQDKFKVEKAWCVFSYSIFESRILSPLNLKVNYCNEFTHFKRDPQNYNVRL